MTNFPQNFEPLPAAIIKSALADRLDYEEWKLKQVDAGLAELKAGKGIPDAEFWASIGSVKNARKKLLEWSPRSRRNIEFIRDYIAPENPSAAQSVLDEIRKTADSIRNFPTIGHIGKRKGTRELVLQKYPYTTCTV